MLVKLNDGCDYRLYFRHYHTQSVLIKKHQGKIDYNDSEIRTIKELVATECFLSILADEDDLFAPAYSFRGISIKSPEDAPNREAARVAAIRHMTEELTDDNTARVWEAYHGRFSNKAQDANDARRT